MKRLLLYQPGSHGDYLSSILSLHDNITVKEISSSLPILEKDIEQLVSSSKDNVFALNYGEHEIVPIYKLINSPSIESVIFVTRKNILKSYVDNLIDSSPKGEYMNQKECGLWIEEIKSRNEIFLNILQRARKIYSPIDYSEISSDIDIENKVWKIRDIILNIKMDALLMEDTEIRKLLTKAPDLIYDYTKFQNIKQIDQTFRDKGAGQIFGNTPVL